MHARLSALRASPETIATVTRVVAEAARLATEHLPGFRDLLLVSNPATGWCLTVSLWENERALQAGERAPAFRQIEAHLGQVATVLPIAERAPVEVKAGRGRVALPPSFAQRLAQPA
jgi:heme-degrading monooxygenase HmoA